jgi:hypothetical protein
VVATPSDHLNEQIFLFIETTLANEQFLSQR